MSLRVDKQNYTGTTQKHHIFKLKIGFKNSRKTKRKQKIKKFH